MILVFLTLKDGTVLEPFLLPGPIHIYHDADPLYGGKTILHHFRMVKRCGVEMDETWRIQSANIAEIVLQAS